jgi:Xaa-Pro dipeptidase
MEREKLDALVCRLAEHVLFLGGYWPICGWVYLVFPREGRPACILPDTELEEAQQELWDAECLPYPFGRLAGKDQGTEIVRNLASAARGRNWRRIGYEGTFDMLAPAGNAAEVYVPQEGSRALLSEAFGGAALIDARPLLDEQRSRKTPYEVRRIRIANEAAALGLAAFREKAAPGVTAVELSAHVESSIMVQGTLSGAARRVRAWAQVAAGREETSRAWRPAEITTARRLQEGDVVMLELAVVADGYWSDRTRTIVAGRISSRLAEVFDAVNRAQERAIAAAAPGVPCAEVDSAAREVMKRAGLEKEFLHATGHGTGFRYHEPHPMIAPGSRETLQEGMIHSVEPGAYSAEFGGVRTEDEVVITATGADVLGPFDREPNQAYRAAGPVS